ncbi:hypothetical protein FM21_35130 [Streptomyces mutabilis]|uniref:Uncharacterized protein n=1 Tax=Streptomyces mutabilis TaxID=67332 RepID=A0A086MRH2_9ACTN|nr:hypothetical protein FM21_35130 [Streptomyces mutabilis]
MQARPTVDGSREPSRGVTIELLLGTRPRRPMLDYCDLWPLSLGGAEGRSSIKGWMATMMACPFTAGDGDTLTSPAKA